MIEISLIKPPTPKRKSSVIKKLILISLLGLALWLFFVEHQDSRFMEKEGFSIQHLRSFLNREDISKQKIRAFLEKTGSFMSANREKPSKRPSVSSAVKVLVQPVVIKPNNRVFEAVGTGRARLSVQIYPAVSEEVLEVLFKAQSKVSKGDVLLRLDNREEVLAVRKAKIELKNKRSLLSRYEKAVKEGAVPESEVDSARADFEGAKVTLDQARLAVEERLVKARFDGVVGIPNVDPGDRVNTNTSITSLDDRKILHVDFEVPEALAGSLMDAQAQKQKITATTPAYPGRTFSAYISAQQSRVDPDRRTLLARASIQNDEDLLRPGMSFSTRWKISGNDYPTVPEISLQWERAGSFIWIIRKRKAEKIYARVVFRQSGRVFLEGTISKGEKVVIEGVQRLSPGTEVLILGEKNP
ncbi:efflux RND transporter periplasmic adaptor subunit [Nitrospinaceae bacterium]|nr:efflux RND transporter periplasmic adaptor subunit [Nitrospinaceae bacterium]